MSFDRERQAFERVYQALTSSYVKNLENGKFHDSFLNGSFTGLIMCLMNLDCQKYGEMIDEINCMLMGS